MIQKLEKGNLELFSQSQRGGYTSRSYSNNYNSSNNYSQSKTIEGSRLKRAFISFHVEDESQVELLRHQAKSDRFDVEFIDYSVKEPFDEKWKTNCEKRIKQSSIVFIMIGPETYKREAVLWEINKAYELEKPVIGIRIYKDQNHPIPKPLLEHNSKIINWDMDKISSELSN